MKKFLLSIFIFVIASTAKQSFSQNLVPNPSFENYLQCPDTFLTTDINNYVSDWQTFRDNPDYYNACASTHPSVNVPQNLNGYQQAATGVGYCGFYTYHFSAPNLREFIGVQLNSALVKGYKYQVAFKVSLIDSANYACNKIGVLFSTIFFHESNPFGTLNNFAHLCGTSTVADKINWTTISGSFVSDSAYKYIVIGDFFDDSHMVHSKVDSTNGYDYAYYFVDDISVISDSTNGITEPEFENSISLSPNPATNQIIIESKQFTKGEIEIFDVMGKKVIGERLSVSGKKEIDVSFFEKGIYFLKVTIGENLSHVAVKKFVKL